MATSAQLAVFVLVSCIACSVEPTREVATTAAGATPTTANGGAKAPEPTVSNEPAQVADSPPAAEPEPGPAYLASSSRGVVRIDSEGQVETLAGDFRQAQVEELLLGPDGVYLSNFVGLQRISPQGFEVVTKPLDHLRGTPEASLFSSDGSYWAVGRGGVGHYVADDWSLTGNEVFGAIVDLVSAVGLDKEQRPWVIARTKGPIPSHGLHVRVGEAWEKQQTPFSPRSLHSTPAGTLYLLGIGGEIARIDGPGTFVELPLQLGDDISIDAVASTPTGELILAVSPYELDGGPKLDHCALLRVDPAQPAAAQRQAIDEPGRCPLLRNLVADGSGRAWATSDMGLHVVDPDGTVHSYPRGSIPALADRIAAVLVVDGGPRLPPTGEVQRGTVTGKLVRDGKPVAGAAVELCRWQHLYTTRPPCSDDPERVASRSDGAGRIRVPDLALNHYALAIEIEGEWTRWRRFEASCMRAGETCDLGDIDVGDGF